MLRNQIYRSKDNNSSVKIKKCLWGICFIPLSFEIGAILTIPFFIYFNVEWIKAIFKIDQPINWIIPLVISISIALIFLIGLSGITLFVYGSTIICYHWGDCYRAHLEDIRNFLLIKIDKNLKRGI